jgi:hypothetical protein
MVAQKNSKTSKTPAPVVEKTLPAEKPVEVAATPSQKGGAKKTKKETVKKAEAEPESKVEAKKNKVVKGKKVDATAQPKNDNKKSKKEAKQPKNVKSNEPVEDGEEGDDDGKTRSFKVQLPNETEFSGRFTGLTPYQAANKALSKFFRNSENTNISSDHIIFSIKESTRGSKRATYTYKGTRIKLEKAITYTIKSADGQERVITKQYKNQLIKVKKGSNNEQVASANA